MKRVTVYMNDGGFYQSVVKYAYTEEICERLNQCQPELFIDIAGIICKKCDIRAIDIEEISKESEGEAHE